jgi:hypothetical protein
VPEKMKQLLELWIFKTLIHLLIIGGNQDNLVLSGEYNANDFVTRFVTYFRIQISRSENQHRFTK